MNHDNYIKVIDFWKQSLAESVSDRLFARQITNRIDIASKEIVDIVGPRRSGKSTVLKLVARQIGEERKTLFVNFEDPFFIANNSADVIGDMIDVYREYFDRDIRYLFFDEIQNIDTWERALRKLRDGDRFKIFITGSSSKLMEGALSTLLTGRHLSYTVLPLSFPEFISFKGMPSPGVKELAVNGARYAKLFDEYLTAGGFPEIVLTGSEELIKQYYRDIVGRDILGRYEVRQKAVLEKMGALLMGNAAKPVSLASIEKTFSISYELASTYLEYFKEAFLIFELPQFSYSVKTQQKSIKKIYAVDTGLAKAVSFRFSEDRGRMLENAVFLHLKRSPTALYYYKTKGNREVDFLAQSSDGASTLLQVCSSFDDAATRDREVKALSEAMREMELSTGYIVAETGPETIAIDGGTIEVVPAVRFLLGDEGVR